MKTMKRLLVLALALSMVFMLVSCGKTLSGTYTAGGDLLGIAGGKTSYTFSGSKVTVTTTTTVLGNSKTNEYEGKYEITEAADGTMTITMTFESEDASEYNVSSKTFKEDKEAGTITIGVVTYTKQ